MTATVPGIFGPFEIVADESLPYGMVGFRATDGVRLCAACGCREDGHCATGHECLTGVGTDNECRCAKFVSALPICPECGSRFGYYWQLQNHLMPTPTCRSSAWGAAGRHAQAPAFVPPLLKDKAR